MQFDATADLREIPAATSTFALPATTSTLTAESPVKPRLGQRHGQPWLRLLSQVLHLAGSGAEFLLHSEKPWSSATFSGTRHTIVMAFEGQDAMARAEAFVARLPDHEFNLSGHLVADAMIVALEHRMAPTPRMMVEAQLLILLDC